MGADASRQLATELTALVEGYDVFDAFHALAWTFGQVLSLVDDDRVDNVVAQLAETILDARRVIKESGNETLTKHTKQ